MKNFLTKEIKEKYILIGVIILMILLFVPIIWLAKYMVPSADDYAYGLESHLAYMNSDSVLDAVKSAYNTMLVKWYTWQGTFTSIFLMSLTPSVFSDKIYGITTFFLLASITVAFLYAAKVFFKDLIKVRDKSWIIIGSLAVILCVETYLSKVEALYWYNSGVHYTFMTASMVMMLALATKIVIESNWKINIVNIIFACIFAFITSGGNYINALLGCILFTTIICFGILYKKKTTFLTLIPALVYGLGFYINVSAPGNTVRQSYFEKKPILDTIVESFKASFLYEAEWSTKFTLI